MSYLREKDFQQLKSRGISFDIIEKQLNYFKKGFSFLPITKPAMLENGILKLKDETIESFSRHYDESSRNQKVVKFVPASGAATRMFKDLYGFLESTDVNVGSDESINRFFNELAEFAFYNQLDSVLSRRGLKIDQLIESGEHKTIIKALLNKEGLNYSLLPKGLLAFHKYGDSCRTAFEEHLIEGIMYCIGKDSKARIHFTVSPEHRDLFENVLDSFTKYSGIDGSEKLSVDFSVQKPSTDTIAVDSNNNPARDKSGNIIFRPGGHGALLDNLADLDADLIFIKNIDNVVPDNLKDETIKYKKTLGGILLSLREQIFHYLNLLVDKRTGMDSGLLNEIGIFLEEELYTIPPKEAKNWGKPELKEYLILKLNRPIRVCGMVKNLGEPGGGPFWVKNGDGTISLQIAESSQLDLSNSLVKKLFKSSTHFNPVDLVCSIKDFRGEKFELRNFCDQNTGFISHKSYEGMDIKALELPGLWNGAMADWNTVFAEVPVSTFNPVKTINDLLRPQHAPS